ncbi:MAG: hypothetical protein JXN60_09615 [Lentisphaerae bacterium]|nr:hypothetical protein [Lentisphaerota bacterium]
MTRRSKEEYLSMMRARYRGVLGAANCWMNAREVCGYDRKYLIRLLGHSKKPIKDKRPAPNRNICLAWCSRGSGGPLAPHE